MIFFNFKFNIIKKSFFILFFVISIFPISSLKSEYKFSTEKEYTEVDAQNIYKDVYILGPGDQLFIKFEDFEEYNAFVTIQNDGNLYLPKIGNVYANNLIIEELNSLVLKKYKKMMKYPIIDVYLKKPRPIKIFITGEVVRPGFYNLSKKGLDSANYFDPEPLMEEIDDDFIDRSPTLFEGIQQAKGITNKTDLENIEFRRKIPEKYGGGYKKTNLNLLSILIDGDDTNNLNLMDGDVIIFKKSNNKIATQIIEASRTNLNPESIGVYITGRVHDPGLKSLRYGSTLMQAIAVAGGPKILRGKIELITSKNDKISIKTYKYNPRKMTLDNNPVLQTGDIVRVGNSVASASTEIISEVVTPLIGINTIMNILENE